MNLALQYTKITKGIMDINVTCKIIKPLEKNRGKYLGLGVGNKFLDLILTTQCVKGRTDKLNLIKI